MRGRERVGVPGQVWLDGARGAGRSPSRRAISGWHRRRAGFVLRGKGENQWFSVARPPGSCQGGWLRKSKRSEAAAVSVGAAPGGGSFPQACPSSGLPTAPPRLPPPSAPSPLPVNGHPARAPPATVPLSGPWLPSAPAQALKPHPALSLAVLPSRRQRPLPSVSTASLVLLCRTPR